MLERRATGYCQRCAQRLDLLIPIPGTGSLELGRVEDLIRFCSGCNRYVGRSCCWRVESATCADCAATPADGRDGDGADGDAIALGAVHILESAPTELAELEAHAAASAAAADPEQALDAWEDAWLEAGTVLARVDSAGEVLDHVDAPAAATAPDRAQPVRSRLQRLLEAAVARRAPALRTLSRAGAQVSSRFPAARPVPRFQARPQSAPARQRRRRLALMLGAAVAAGLLIVLGAAAITGLQQRGQTGESPPVAAQATPSATTSSPVTPTANARPRTLAQAAFDLAFLGPLDADAPVRDVHGSVAVVAFPTSFDRSARLGGPDVSGLCVDASEAADGPLTAVFDLMNAPDARPAPLLITLPTPDGAASFEADAQLGTRSASDPWSRLTVTWGPGAPSADMAPRDGGTAVPVPLRATAEPAAVADDVVCLWLDATAADHAILLDQVEVRQP